MKLYGFVLSPFTQRVLIAARIKGHEIPVEGPPGGALTAPAFAAISPMRRIPVLEEADGWRISESAAIVAYLDETLPGPPLLPADPRDRALARQVAGLGDTEIGAGIRHLMVQNVFCSASNKGQLDYGREQLALGFAALQRIGIGRWAWATGREPGIADAALIPLLALTELIETHFDGGKLLKPYPAIRDYWARAQVSPIGARTVAEMGALVPIVMARREAARA
jgi:glutathione S-transferase